MLFAWGLRWATIQFAWGLRRVCVGLLFHVQSVNRLSNYYNYAIVIPVLYDCECKVCTLPSAGLSGISGLEHWTGLLDWTNGALKINSEKPCQHFS